MNNVLDLIVGSSWSVAYIVAIISCFRNKVCYIPPVSICMNFSWELLVVVDRLQNQSINLPFFVQLTWLLLDVFIVGTWLFFESKKWKHNISVFIIAFSLVYGLAYVAGKWKFSVFLINAIMSCEFLYRYIKDDNFPGSTAIATMKLIGTLTATIMNGWIYWNSTVLWLGGLCFLVDFYYLRLLIRSEKEGENDRKQMEIS